ncbi:MAG: DUF6088 family protein [Gemmatimonadota bacterium]
MPRPTSPTSVEQRIRAKLRRKRNADSLTLLAPSDFASIGSRRAIDIALHRLTVQGVTRRLSRGLYHIPRTHPILGELTPGADAVIAALAAKHRLRRQPSGAYAANLLGLSTQVPLRLVYLTDGPTRHIRIGMQEIVLKRTTPKNMATAGKVSGLTIQALRYLGKAQVDNTTVATLRRRMGPTERKQLRADAHLAPAWIADIMRQIASGKGERGRSVSRAVIPRAP